MAGEVLTLAFIVALFIYALRFIFKWGDVLFTKWFEQKGDAKTNEKEYTECIDPECPDGIYHKHS